MNREHSEVYLGSIDVSQLNLTEKTEIKNYVVLQTLYLVISQSSPSRIQIYVTKFIYIQRVSQEERTIFWEVIVSVILSKKLYMNMRPIPNGFRDRTASVV
jgi:hypothetical protein